MALSDTAEYWWDVKGNKGYFPNRNFTHIKGADCGHYHVHESNELDEIDCHACKRLIEGDENLKELLLKNNGNRQRKAENKRKKKKGYKLASIIKFGKFKNDNRCIQDLILNEKSYWSWLKDKILLHPEIDTYLEEIKEN